MRRLTLRQLMVFEAVARHLSFSKAAEELYLTQPAVSMQVRQLEKFVGLDLTEQVGKRIFLTDAGRVVFHASKNITAQLRDLGAALSRMKGVSEGQLDLAVTSTVNAVATGILARFRDQYPQVAIHLDVSNRAEVLGLLTANKVDLAVMGQVPRELGLTATRFMENPLVVIAPPDHPLAGRTQVSIEEISSEAFVVREEGSGTRAAMERFFAARDIEIRTSMEMNSNEALRLAVQAGLGLGVISLQTLELELALKRLVVLPVEGFPIIRHWYVVQRADKRLSPVSQAFKDYLLSEVSETPILAQP
ncbi:transcriptional regulator [Halothiobacillus diazotrophicus]|uniref:Transcriptional regulator n=1 Tax=Halothiobacillus diazotrophicus TaxID=1860122 RepID=A0A191ZGQ2_9GAMM|nr:LysR family transcriptional regulator [Halothiobacillus diazotrophicus]ANJ67032.1 transcriptional regulator [Halothiobacillus diazotrophicus]